MKSGRFILKIIVLSAVLFLVTAAAVFIKTRRTDEVKNEDRAVWKDGRQIPLNDEQWRQMEDIVVEGIFPGLEVDRMWTKEQIDSVRRNGLAVECTMPEGHCRGEINLYKYIVISGEEYRYLIVRTDNGMETYDLSEQTEAKILEIIEQ